MKCKTCGENARDLGHSSSTLVGYMSPPGHDHDDNCVNKTDRCPNGHNNSVSLRNRCSDPECDWVGKDSCFCHDGPKVDEWPE